MADPAAELGATLLRVLREASPASAPSVPRWRRIEAEAALRGFSSTRALRDWCLRRDVPLREDSYRDTWVSPQAIDEAVERLPRAEPAAQDREGVCVSQAGIGVVLKAPERLRRDLNPGNVMLDEKT